MALQWHELDQQTHERLARPLDDAAIDRILQAVYGDELRPVAEHVAVWVAGARREGLCWWSFQALTPQDEKVSLSVFFWDLHAVLTWDDRLALGDEECLALERRLSALAREWGIAREVDVEALAMVRVLPQKRRRPSGLARLAVT